MKCGITWYENGVEHSKSFYSDLSAALEFVVWLMGKGIKSEDIYLGVDSFVIIR